MPCGLQDNNNTCLMFLFASLSFTIVFRSSFIHGFSPRTRCVFTTYLFSRNACSIKGLKVTWEYFHKETSIEKKINNHPRLYKAVAGVGEIFTFCFPLFLAESKIWAKCSRKFNEPFVIHPRRKLILDSRSSVAIVREHLRFTARGIFLVWTVIDYLGACLLHKFIAERKELQHFYCWASRKAKNKHS